jgi:hypothetical protein
LAIVSLGDQWELVDTIKRTAKYDVFNVAAPVFGPQRDVVLAIVVNSLGAMTGMELIETADRIASAARLVTKNYHGTEPD